jgi:hypothetical protein
VQYQLLGVGSGFFAHILATLLVCWRRTLRTGMAVGGLAALAVELVGFELTHQFPPSVATHALAAALALALAYGAGATVFASELLRGALRALSLMQGEAIARTEAARLTAQARSGGVRKGLVTPLPLLSERALRPGVAGSPRRRLAPSALQVQTSLPLSDAHHRVRAPAEAPQVFVPMFVPGGAVSGMSESSHSFENDPTQPITVCEEDSATVMLLPENSLYVPRFLPKSPSAAPAPAFRPPQSSWPSRPAQSGRMGRMGRMGALPPLAEAGSGAAPIAAPWASASPPPDLYAPWSAVPPLEPAQTAIAPT